MKTNFSNNSLIDTVEATVFSKSANIVEQQLQVAALMIDRLKQDGNAVVKAARKAAAIKEANNEIEYASDDEELLNAQQIVADMDNMKEQLQLVMRKLRAYSQLCRKY